MLPDDRLAAMVRAGSEPAFEALFDRHHRTVLSFCRHLVGSTEEAEDAVQHTFLAAYRQLRHTHTTIHLRPWLYTVARNRCLSVLRARRERPLDVADEPATDNLASEVQRREDLRDLLRDLGTLPEEQRAALVLAELGAASHEEIGEILGCPRAKVKALVFQARSSLIATRHARDTPCADIRAQIALPIGGAGARRTTVHRHLRECPGCRDFRDQVRGQRRALACVLPVVPSLALREGLLAAIGGTAAGGAALTAGGAAVTATGGSVAAKVFVGLAVAGGGTAAGVEVVKHKADRAPASARAAAPERPSRATADDGPAAAHVSAVKRPPAGAGVRYATPVRAAAPATGPRIGSAGGRSAAGAPRLIGAGGGSVGAAAGRQAGNPADDRPAAAPPAPAEGVGDESRPAVQPVQQTVAPSASPVAGGGAVRPVPSDDQSSSDPVAGGGASSGGHDHSGPGGRHGRGGEGGGHGGGRGGDGGGRGHGGSGGEGAGGSGGGGEVLPEITPMPTPATPPVVVPGTVTPGTEGPGTDGSGASGSESSGSGASGSRSSAPGATGSGSSGSGASGSGSSGSGSSGSGGGAEGGKDTSANSVPDGAGDSSGSSSGPGSGGSEDSSGSGSSGSSVSSGSSGSSVSGDSYGSAGD